MALNRTLTANGPWQYNTVCGRSVKSSRVKSAREKTQVCQSSVSSPPFLCSDTWKTDQSHTDFTAHSGKMMRKTVRRAFAKNKLGPHKCEVFVLGFHGAQRLGTRLLQTNQTKQPSKFVQIVFIPRGAMKSVHNFFLDTKKKKPPSRTKPEIVTEHTSKSC